MKSLTHTHSTTIKQAEIRSKISDLVSLHLSMLTLAFVLLMFIFVLLMICF